jgi:error-prone DNA polymerase
MPGRVVVQWDKDDCADMGLVKVDLLGLGMMAALQDALALINGESNLAAEHAEIAESFSEKTNSVSSAVSASSAAKNDRLLVDLAHLPSEDPLVYRMLCDADTVGVFQVESRAQMATLPRLKPTTFYDIVVQVAIIRPGPSSGRWCIRFESSGWTRARAVCASLARTIRSPRSACRCFRNSCGLPWSPPVLEGRRKNFAALGFKRSAWMKQVEVQLREGMARQGITGAAADQIALSIRSFAWYGFPESHAASFALLAYASAYLKVHYPAAFYTALLNNQPMGFYHPSTLVKDAQRRGVRFQPIDVQVSDWDCTVERGRTVGSVRRGGAPASVFRQKATSFSNTARAYSLSCRSANSPYWNGRSGKRAGLWLRPAS